jgi:mono/diheme cytochrome c family protein
MATSTKTNTAAPDFEAATERAREANDRLAEVSRKVTTAYLDGVEKYVSGIAQFERKVGTQTQVDAVASLLKTHADMTEEITRVSVSAARELITA